jgi:K+-sensing histidine kinase KdpD
MMKWALQKAIPPLTNLNDFIECDKFKSSSGSGTGLGLAIVRWIAEVHGGQVSVVNRKRGGMHFSVSLSDKMPSKANTTEDYPCFCEE